MVDVANAQRVPLCKGYKEGPSEGTLNLIPLYNPYIYLI